MAEKDLKAADIGESGGGGASGEKADLANKLIGSAPTDNDDDDDDDDDVEDDANDEDDDDEREEESYGQPAEKGGQ